jgi:hypothetical protein
MSVPGSLAQAVSYARAPYVFRLRQGIAETIVAPLRRQGGASPALASNYGAELAMVSHQGASGRVVLAAASVDSAAATATFVFSATHVASPALLLARINIENATGTAVDRLPCFVEVAPDFLEDNSDFPVTIDAVRDDLQDRSAADNRVLDATEFEDGEIASALFKAVDHWNEVAYPGLPMYTATSFPFREQLRRAAKGRAMLDRGGNLQRNRVPSMGEGLQVDDVQHRIELYMKEGQALWDEFRAFVTAKIQMHRYAQFLGDTPSRYY